MVIINVVATTQTSYEEVSRVRTLISERSARSSQRSHLQQQKQQQQPSPPPTMPQQQSAIFQQPPPPPPPPQQQQVILSATPQYQAFSVVDTISPSQSPPSHPPAPPQLPNYSLPQGYKPPQQTYHRASPQQQASYQNFRLPASPQSSTHSPTEQRQSPTLKAHSIRSNSLPGAQDDTFVIPKVSHLHPVLFCLLVPSCSQWNHQHFDSPLIFVDNRTHYTISQSTV